MAIGDNIKKARKTAKLTQKQLSEKINKGFSTVQKYELGLFIPPISVIKEISIALNVSVEELLNDGDLPWEKKGAQINDLDKMLDIGLDDLTPDERIRLLSSITVTVEYLTRITQKEREASFEQLSDIIFLYGVMIVTSWKMVSDTPENPTYYNLLCQYCEKAKKQFENHKEALIKYKLPAICNNPTDSLIDGDDE